MNIRRFQQTVTPPRMNPGLPWSLTGAGEPASSWDFTGIGNGEHPCGAPDTQSDRRRARSAPMVTAECREPGRPRCGDGAAASAEEAAMHIVDEDALSG